MPVLPTSARQRVDDAELIGRVQAIQIRPKRRLPVEAVESWDLTSTVDHARSKTRAVTLIQAEHLPVVSALLGHDVRFDQTRRNLLVSGLNLDVCRGRELRIGAVVLGITARCHPCARMEEDLGKGGFAAMYGHGGWCARIVTPGTVHVGDSVGLLPYAP